MPSTISAGTTAGTAIAIAGDTTGNLAFQTNGTTTAMTIDTSQNVTLGGPTANLYVNATTATNNSNIWIRSGGTDTLGFEAQAPISAGGGGGGFISLRNPSGTLNFRTTTGGSSLNTVMTIDGSGRVVTPYQPAFMTRKSNGNVASGAIIPFGIVALNIGSHYNASTYTFTAPVAGNYFFTLNVAVENSGSYTAYIVWNGTDFTGGEVAASANWQQSTATCILPLAAGDTVYTRMVGSWTNVDAGQWTGFGGYLLG